MYNSTVSNVGKIVFPEFKPERIYMKKFFKKSGLPKEYKHWQDTIDQMLEQVDTDEAIYLMIDSAFIKANDLHRREGLHVDGYWFDCETLSCHGSHRSIPPTHRSDTPLHRPIPPTHRSSQSFQYKDDWSKATLQYPESLILASNYTSSRGFIGEWNGIIEDGGSCENIDVSNMKEVLLEKDNIYISNVGFIHESLPVREDVERTLIRLNVKNWNYS